MKKIVSIFQFSLLLFASSLVVTLFVISIIVLCFREYENEHDVSTTFRKRIYRFNPSTNTHSSGFTSNLEFNEHENSRFYIDDSGTYTLISNFETDEYKCTGSCVCEEEEEEETSNYRRLSSAKVVSKGILYFVGALSSYLAYQNAEEYFHKQCEKQDDLECSTTTKIRGEVEGCDLIHVSFAKKQNTLKNKQKKKQTKAKSVTDDQIKEQLQRFQHVPYECSGSCFAVGSKLHALAKEGLTKYENRKERQTYMKHFLDIGKETMKSCDTMTHTIQLSGGQMVNFLGIDPETLSSEVAQAQSKNLRDEISGFVRQGIYDDGSGVAEIIFAYEHLIPFCRETSEFVIDVNGAKKKEDFVEDDQKNNFCQAWDGEEEGVAYKEDLNPTLKCEFKL